MHHWTSPRDDNYSALTAHYIEDWKLRSLLIDFKVWHGSTAGALLAEDLIRVAKKYSIHASIPLCTTDTTGNMITLGRSLRSKNVEHDFCVDHVLHLIAQLVFDDDNIPGGNNAMSAARALVAFFTASTQATAKLMDFQRNSGIDQYVNAPHPLKVIQDVITRWWSTLRMLRRLRFLRPAIAALIASGEVQCQNLQDYQWEILHQIESALEPMASAQRILEGEKYPIGSLVCYCIHQIRMQFNEIICGDAAMPVKMLVQKLKSDLEVRYHFELSGALKYPSSNAITGHGNRYVTVH